LCYPYQHTQHDEPGPKGFTPTTSQPVAQEPDGGNTLVESPSVESQIVTSVITSTVIVLPTPLPAFGSESTNPGGNGPPSGGPPQKDGGLSPPPAVMQWVQCVLVSSELTWLFTSKAVHLSRKWRLMDRLMGRYTPDSDKHGGDESDSEKTDSQDEGKNADTSGISKKVASTTVSQHENSTGGTHSKDFFGLLLKLTQDIGGKGPSPNSPSCN